MHIAEGILDAPALAAGAAVTVVGVAIGLRRMELEIIPRAAVLSSALFVASLIQVPLGPASAHLTLIGLAGVVLGWAAFPAFLVALLLQCVFFGYGGVAVLGVNTANMALAAVLCRYVFRLLAPSPPGGRGFAAGFVAGTLGILAGALFVSLALLTTGRAFAVVAATVFAAHVPVAAVEGLVTGWAVALLSRVRPEVLPSGTCPEEEHSLA